MQKLLLASTLTLSALLATTLPAQAQFVSIPVTNGNFAITNTAGTVSYSVLPTFLSPAGTLTVTTANVSSSFYSSLVPVTVNTPVGFATNNATFNGSLTLSDGRTANFTGAGASLRGTATVTGGTMVATGGGFTLFSGALPTGATFTYTVQSGAVQIPQSSLGAYPTPQFTIPVSGGSFTLTDPTGTGNATVVLNSVLTPLGTANLTVNLPNLGGVGSFPVAAYLSPALAVTFNGLANGTVALSDGRIATVSDRLITLTASTQVVTLPAGTYVQGASPLATPVTIQGTITGGSISVPQSAVVSPPAPVQPPVVLPVQPPVQSTSPPVVPPAPVAKRPEFVLGFAQNLNLGGEPEAYLKLVEAGELEGDALRFKVARRPVQPEDLPEVEQSALAFSRIHPGCNSYSR